MQRRFFIAMPLLVGLPARAHHGWSSFDQTRPLYLEGKVAQVAWRNPHVELKLDLPADGLKLPGDLSTRSLPAQTAPVDGPALLKAAQLPTRKDRRWEIELAPLSRMQAWGVPEIKVGDVLAMLGSPSPVRRATPSCGWSICSPAARPTACVRRRPEGRGVQLFK